MDTRSSCGCLLGCFSSTAHHVTGIAQSNAPVSPRRREPHIIYATSKKQSSGTQLRSHTLRQNSLHVLSEQADKHEITTAASAPPGPSGFPR